MSKTALQSFVHHQKIIDNGSLTMDHRPLTIDHKPLPIVHRPSSKDHKPLSIVHRPSSIDHSPLTIDCKPSTHYHCPSSIVHRPKTMDHKPLSIVHRPKTIDHRPLTIDCKPSTHYHGPLSIVYRPLSILNRLSSIVRRPSSIVVLLLSLVFFSCTTQKNLTYLQDIDQSGAENFFPLERPDYKLQKQDILYIKFFTLNTEINDMLNGGSQMNSQQMYNGESGLYINGYNVSDSGTITIPIIGDIKVEGLSVDQSRLAIQEKSKDYLKDATVIVKLLSFKFSVLGEVKKPGTYKNYNNQLTVLEAISMAGDITDFGDRSRVLVIRPTKNGSKTYRIDLKKKDVLASEAYFLLPNDMVIVEPINSKVFQLNIPLISLLFTTISTTVLVLNFIK